ncbi:substrate-binding domain-containing protein [Roseibium sp. M-1]
MYRLVITTCIFILSACLHAGASCIGVIPAGAEHLFWLEVIRGARTAAAEHKFQTYVRSPNTERNEAGQILIIEKALDEGCRGILVAPNTTDVTSKIPRLAETGTPVVYFDRDMGGSPASIIKTDNFEAGALAGRELVKRMNNTGRVAVLRMHIEVTSTTDREAGFLSAIQDSGLRVVHEQYIGATVEEAREYTSMMVHSGLGFDAIFTPNESTTLGTLLTLKQLKLAGKVHHVGFDFTPVLLAALRKGEISGLILQQPYKMGYVGTQILIEAMQGENVPKSIAIPAYYVDAANIDDPEIQAIVDVDYE